MRLALAVFLALAAVSSLAQSIPTAATNLLRELSRPGVESVVASTPNQSIAAHYPIVALVFPRENAASIVVLDEDGAGKVRVVAASKDFGYYESGNYTATPNEFASNGPDRFYFEVSFRAGCARGTRTHRFALRDGAWMVVGLDQSVLTCSDDAVVQDWKSSENFLTGKVERTVFANDKPYRTVRKASMRKAFPLSAFPPNDPDYEELQ